MGRKKRKTFENLEEETQVKEAKIDREVSLSPVLTPDQLTDFREKGFIHLSDVFSPKAAAAGRELIWKHLEREGIEKEDPLTWNVRQGIAQIYTPEDGAPWDQIITPKLTTAIDQLCGENKWESFGCGWWVISFPEQSNGPWGASGKWHVDGAHYQHHVNSKESGLVAIFLFSTIKPQAGGTALCVGSHRQVAQLLYEHEPKGLRGNRLNMAALERVQSAGMQIHEIQGQAGDVVLLHPFLLHARSKNLGKEGVDSVRFMCNPNIGLKKPMRFPSQPAHLAAHLLKPKDKTIAYTPVEQAIVDALRSIVEESESAIDTTAE